MSEAEPQYKPGDPCKKTELCPGKLVVDQSRLTRNNRVRRLRCNKCNKRHGKSVGPNELVDLVANLAERVKNLEESAAKHAASSNGVR